jgi:hypothetical protein
MRTKFLALVVSFLVMSLLLQGWGCGREECRCEGWSNVEVTWLYPTSQSHLWTGSCGDSLSLTICQGGDVWIHSSFDCSFPNCTQYFSWAVTGPDSYYVHNGSGAPPFCFEPPQGGSYLLTLNGTCEGRSCPPCTLNLNITVTMPQCESEEFIACDCDDFVPGTETPAPSTALLSWIAANYAYNGTRECDEKGQDRYWAHTFTDLCKPCCNITGASLEITILNQGANDALLVGFITGSTSTWAVSHRLDWTGWPGGGIPLGSNGTITLDLSSVYQGNTTTLNLLSTIKSNCFLDVAVEDDSAVDCARLTITYG